MQASLGFSEKMYTETTKIICDFKNCDPCYVANSSHLLFFLERQYGVLEWEALVQIPPPP
jgi:hydrogenase maturation factor